MKNYSCKVGNYGPVRALTLLWDVIRMIDDKCYWRIFFERAKPAPLPILAIFRMLTHPVFTAGALFLGRKCENWKEKFDCRHELCLPICLWL